VYGEWIKIRFPRKCYVQDVLYTPFSLATSIGQGYLLGSNDEFDWEPVYPINKTFINLNEMSLINVGGVLPVIYTGSSKAFKYFTFMATTIQGTSGAAAGSTEKFAITNLRFTLYDSWVYHDNIISVGTFPLGTPVSNALDVNGNAYVSGQIITDGGINVLSGDINITGEFRKNGTIFTGGATTFDASAITSGILGVNRGGTGNNTFSSGRILFGGPVPALGAPASAIGTSTQLNWNNTNSTLGVGSTASTTVRLDVGQGYGSIGTAIPRRYFDQGTALTTLTGSGFGNISIKAFGSILSGSAFISTSDNRIKEDIQDINDDNALQLLLAIEPKTYKYIDKVALNKGKVYGFIAQQVMEIIPCAITIRTDYIPNIMLLADFNDCIITLPSQPTKVIIKQNDKIKCYNETDEIVYIIVEEVINDLTFKIKPLDIPYNDNKIFVYGTEVDDFHTLNKDYIFTLNVCATQELHRRMEAQEERIKELETKLEKLINYIYQ
jgi:hypothetical protein